MNSADLQEARENIRTASRTLRAYMDFRAGVGALMLRLVARDDPAGFVLLELVRDLDARTQEHVMSEENG